MVDGDAKRVAEAGLSDYQLLKEIDWQKERLSIFAASWQEWTEGQKGEYLQDIENELVRELEKLRHIVWQRGLLG